MSKFSFTGNEHTVAVTRTGTTQELKLRPAEVEKATTIIGIALQMETMEAIPDHIKNSPFVIRFFEDDLLALERADAKGSVSFKWDEGDELILAIQSGLKIAINSKVNKHKRLKPTRRTN